MGCDVAVAEARIAAKEVLLDPKLTTLETAQTCVNGKHLLHHVYVQYISSVRRGLPKDVFANLLIRTIKARLGLHQDIRTIMEQRILA